MCDVFNSFFDRCIKDQDEIRMLRDQLELLEELLKYDYENWGWQHLWTDERMEEFQRTRERGGWQCKNYSDYQITYHVVHKAFYFISLNSRIVDRKARPV